MKCLHICNDFSDSKVHTNLYSQLDDLEVEQVIYNPVRNSTTIGKNIINFKNSSSKIIYSKMLKRYHRILFRNKKKFLFNDLNSKYPLNTVDIVHATTLYSDGAVALKIYKKYLTPYIVAVRGTDVSLFLKFRPDLIFLLKDILIHARKIVFLSDVLKEKFFDNNLIKSLKLELMDKVVVISNGIDSFWLLNLMPKKKINPHKILFIGKYNYNKNTLALIEAVLKLQKEFPNLTLEVVGKGGSNEDEVIRLSKLHPNIIHFHGAIFDKVALQKIYLSNHIFAMPSHSETFGLVYLEALSQGLPIVCSKNQGIDGTFKINIGEYVNPKSVDSIANGIRKVLQGYNNYNLDEIDFSVFQWEKIAKKYLNIYSGIT